MHFRAFVRCFGLLPGLFVNASSAEEITRTTADGTWGADTFIQFAGKPVNFGANTSMQAKNQGARRKIYLRFDLQGVDTRRLERVLLEMVVASSEFDLSDLETGAKFRVFGLNDGTVADEQLLGEDWGEGNKNGKIAEAHEITYANAPARSHDETAAALGPKVMNGGQARQLGTFTLIDKSENLGRPFVVLDSADSQALLNFIRSDTNGHVTFIITRQQGHTSTNITFATKENTKRLSPPTLRLHLTQAAQPAP